MTSKWLARLEDFESDVITEQKKIPQSFSPLETVEVKNLLVNQSEKIIESRFLQILEAVTLYKMQGWIRIHSSYLAKDIYLKKNKWTKVPNRELAVYTENEIKALKDLSKEELMTLHDAKVIFQGTISND